MAETMESMASDHADCGRHFASHMMTYTAGEETSRMAAAAKELGLEASRRPRQQVRRPKLHTSLLTRHQWLDLLLDSTNEDALMKSVVSMHEPQYDQSWPVLPGFFETAPPQVLEGDYGGDQAEGSGETMSAAILGTIKGMVGPAVLYLPHGFANAGYMAALPILSVCTIIFLYSSRCLLISWQHVHNTLQQSETMRLLSGEHPKRVVVSYPELAYRGLGPHGEALVKAGIALMQFGVCLTYLIFVPLNLQATSMYLFGWNIPAKCWLIVMVIIELPLSWLRDIRKLTPTNLIANALIAFGLITCLGFALVETVQGNGSCIENVARHVEALVPFKSTCYLFFGKSILLFEGSITLLLPLQEAVHRKACRERFPVIFERIVLVIVLFYAIFGLCCWTAFGSDVRIVLTKSLPENSLLASTVQLAYSVAVILTFPLQNFPALEITTRAIKSAFRTTRPGSVLRHRSVTSGALILALAAVAATAMESLDRVVSLMGSLLGCPIAFVVPPLIYAYIVPDLSPGQVWGNRAVVALGVVATVGASLVTLRS